MLCENRMQSAHNPHTTRTGRRGGFFVLCRRFLRPRDLGACTGGFPLLRDYRVTKANFFRKRFIDPALIPISGATLFHSKYNVRIIRI